MSIILVRVFFVSYSTTARYRARTECGTSIRVIRFTYLHTYLLMFLLSLIIAHDIHVSTIKQLVTTISSVLSSLSSSTRPMYTWTGIQLLSLFLQTVLCVNVTVQFTLLAPLKGRHIDNSCNTTKYFVFCLRRDSVY